MHINATTSDLNYALNIATRAIAIRPVKNVYKGVLIETTDNGVLMTTTDGEMSIKTHVNATVLEEGSVVMPAKLFSEIIKKQESGFLDIQVKENLRTVIKNNQSKTNLLALEGEDFPDVMDLHTEHVITMPCSALKNAISKVAFSISLDESRKILTGILLDVRPEEVRLVTIDGFRLAMQRIITHNELTQEKVKLVIPGNIMSEISKILPDDDEIPVHIKYTKTHVEVLFQNVQLLSTLLIGEFIDYERIIPNSFVTEITLDCHQFADAVDRCALMSREAKENLVNFHVQQDVFTITAASEQGDIKEIIEVNGDFEEIKLTFNTRFMMDIIRNVEGEKTMMCINTNVSPVVFRPLGNDKFLYLILPVRTFQS